MGLQRSGFIEVDGAALHYSIVGAGPPLVILHGGPGLGCGYLRDEVARLLSGSFRLIFYDQRASGRSSGDDDPDRITMTTFVGDLEKVREAAGITSVRLLGHSFGGLLAMHYAIDHPGRVEALLLVDSDPASRELWSRHQGIVASRRREDDERELFAIRSAMGWEFDQEAVERYLRVLMRGHFAERTRAGRLRFDVESLPRLEVTGRLIRASMGRFDIHDRLSRIACPTLIMYGDHTIYPREAVGSLSAAIPGSRLVILKGCGHFPFLEVPGEFARVVRDFLSAGIG